MELTLLRKLVRLMARGELTELEVEDEKEGIKIRLKRAGDASASPLVHVHQGGPLPAAALTAPPAPGAAGTVSDPEDAEHPPGTEPFPSPMVGTFYRSPSPDAEPYAEVGTKVDEDSVLCIIEAMKVMNEIKAEMRGEVLELLVENGEPVEFGQPLFLIKRT